MGIHVVLPGSGSTNLVLANPPPQALDFDQDARASRIAQEASAARPRQLPLASRSRGFFVPGDGRTAMDRYDAAAIEAKWQRVWEDARAFYVDDPDPSVGDRKSYVLEMLPYPSGELHMGHVLNYTLGDVLTHHRRRSGMTVLRPMGFDAFGLPAENAAIKEGIDPRASTDANIEKITAQMRRLGWAIDWPRASSPRTSRTSIAGRSGCSCASSSAAGLQGHGAGEVVPERSDRARERAGRGRALLPLWLGGRVAEPRAVDVRHNALRRRAAGRDEPARVLAGVDLDHAAELDRPLRGCGHPLPHP